MWEVRLCLFWCVVGAGAMATGCHDASSFAADANIDGRAADSAPIDAARPDAGDPCILYGDGLTPFPDDLDVTAHAVVNHIDDSRGDALFLGDVGSGRARILALYPRENAFFCGYDRSIELDGLVDPVLIDIAVADLEPGPHRDLIVLVVATVGDVRTPVVAVMNDDLVLAGVFPLPVSPELTSALETPGYLTLVDGNGDGTLELVAGFRGAAGDGGGIWCQPDSWTEPTACAVSDGFSAPNGLAAAPGALPDNPDQDCVLIATTRAAQVYCEKDGAFEYLYTPSAFDADVIEQVRLAPGPGSTLFGYAFVFGTLYAMPWTANDGTVHAPARFEPWSESIEPFSASSVSALGIDEPLRSILVLGRSAEGTNLAYLLSDSRAGTSGNIYTTTVPDNHDQLVLESAWRWWTFSPDLAEPKCLQAAISSEGLDGVWPCN